jgi:diamine N-acetyltransferase
MPPNNSLQVSAGCRLSQLALSGAGCVSPPAPPELHRSASPWCSGKNMVQKPDVTIRRANSADASLLAELGARTFSETFSGDNTHADMAAYLASSFNLARQTVELADPASTFLIAEVGGAATGYAQLHAGQPAEGIEGAKPVELVRLYVSREWLGLGVGMALMRACVNEAQQAGHATIWLGVWEENRRAQSFYRKWNFRAIGEHVFQLGSDPQRDILMERAL